MKGMGWKALPALLLILWALGCAAARGEQICVFRVRPEVTRVDRERADGLVFLGRRQGKQQTAQLSLGLEGRSPEGNTWPLAELIRQRQGTVTGAWWRLEGTEIEAKGARFLLWPEGGRMASTVRTAFPGWNLWEITDYMRAALTEGEAFSLRVQTADGEDTGSFDFQGSRIYVTVAFPSPQPDLEESRIADSQLLDAALSALPADHWALRRYREETGSLLQARWPETGVPYYFGGHSEEKVMHRFFPLQESRYYRSDRLYLCGFDCGSYLHWVEEQAGCLPHPDLSDILQQRGKAFPMASLALRVWHQALVPGDLIVMNHGSYHVGMYLGTPRMFGLTAESAPELADWLDAPLLIHCGEDPFCYDRFSEYIAAQDYRMTTSPPDGGVTVSLLVPRLTDAPHVRQAPWGREYGYFLVGEQPLTVLPLADCTELAWTRPVEP